MRTRLGVLAAAAVVAAATLATGSTAAVPGTVDLTMTRTATMPHAAAPATMPHASDAVPVMGTAMNVASLAAAASWKCGSLSSGSNSNGEWGRAQVCVMQTSSYVVWSVAVRDSKTDGHCVVAKRRHPNYSSVYQSMTPEVQSCTTMGWKTIVNPKPSPFAGVRLYRGDMRDWVQVDMPTGW
jgi:hypothetical protein